MNNLIQNNELYQIFIDPIMNYLGHKVNDLTYGRKDIVKNLFEKKIAKDGLLHDEIYLKDNDNPTIYYQTLWDKVNHPEPKGELVHSHGFADYGGRFVEASRNFLNEGYRLHILDLPSHGRSDGVHCSLNDFNELVSAINRVVCNVKQQFPNKKYFLMGGSMGGVTIIKYGMEFPSSVDGILAVCPALGVNKLMLPPQAIIQLATMLNYIIPRMIGAPRKDNMATSNPKDDINFINDPMTYSGGLRINTGLAIHQGSEKVRQNSHSFNQPILIQQGDKDRMVDPLMTQLFFDECTSLDKTLKVYQHQEHDLQMADPLPEVFTDAIQWMNDRL